MTAGGAPASERLKMCASHVAAATGPKLFQRQSGYIKDWFHDGYAISVYLTDSEFSDYSLLIKFDGFDLAGRFMFRLSHDPEQLAHPTLRTSEIFKIGSNAAAWLEKHAGLVGYELSKAIDQGETKDTTRMLKLVGVGFLAGVALCFLV